MSGQKKQTRGEAFSAAVLETYQLRDDEKELLREVSTMLDQIDALDALVASDGLMVKGSRGTTELHPAAKEARQLRIALRAYIRSLRLPDPETGVDDITAQARQAGTIRWGKRKVSV